MSVRMMIDEMRSRVSQDEINDFIKEYALSNYNPDNYVSYLDDDEKAQWLIVPRVGIHRDSEVLDISNNTAAQKMFAEIEAQYDTHRASHWAVGWVESLVVDITNTDAVLLAMHIERFLEDYPILDEEDFGEREYDEGVEYFNDHVRTDLMREVADDIYQQYNLIDGGTGDLYEDVYDIADVIESLEDFDHSPENLLALCGWHYSLSELENFDPDWSDRQKLVEAVLEALDKAGFVLQEYVDDYGEE